jgi:hypothetical protein
MKNEKSKRQKTSSLKQKKQKSVGADFPMMRNKVSNGRVMSQLEVEKTWQFLREERIW